ncbi:MAG: hypothetical protein Q4F31_05505 [Eubacteriales bacterium]|nr:hypothetical protein [Eubacteriales bacterium]
MDNNDKSTQLFRAKSLDRLSSPEDLSDYVRVANPGVWIVLCAVVILLAGMLVWAALGVLDTTIDAVCISDNGKGLCYISEENIGKVQNGMRITLSDGTEATVTGISPEAEVAEEVLTDYQMHLADVEEGEWIHALDTDLSFPEDDIFSPAKVTIDSIHPIEFIFS